MNEDYVVFARLGGTIFLERENIVPMLDTLVEHGILNYMYHDSPTHDSAYIHIISLIHLSISWDGQVYTLPPKAELMLTT